MSEAHGQRDESPVLMPAWAVATFVTMPVISMFYGIVAMDCMDTKLHNHPHIHVKYQDSEAVFRIPDGSLLEGSLPKGKVTLVEAWIELHQEELIANWALAVAGQRVFQIAPLK